MIKDIRENKPFIHFGFNKLNRTAYLNEQIEIWQDKIFSDEYDFTLISDSPTIISTNRNKIVIKFTTLGTKQVKLNFENKDKSFDIDSNQININVVEITADAINITADSNKVTADGSIII